MTSFAQISWGSAESHNSVPTVQSLMTLRMQCLSILRVSPHSRSWGDGIFLYGIMFTMKGAQCSDILCQRQTEHCFLQHIYSANHWKSTFQHWKSQHYRLLVLLKGFILLRICSRNSIVACILGLAFRVLLCFVIKDLLG